MSVQQDGSGRRWVEVDIEVPGTPEEVWQAVATGPGISSWFVPTEMSMGPDGVPEKVVSNFGPGMDSVATVTAWDAPQRFAAHSQDLGPDAPPVATEWIVEARSGGTCVVRVVHSLVTSSDEWDSQLEMWQYGWPDFFRILRLYVTHFLGRPCSAFQLMGAADPPAGQVWQTVTGPLGLSGATAGESRKSPDGAPPLAGVVEEAHDQEHSRQLLLRLQEPAPGIAHLFVLPMGDRVHPVVRFYLFGDGAGGAAERAEPIWNTWMTSSFPMPVA